MVTNDAELARDVAQAAGQRLIALRRDFGPVDAADRDQIRALRDAADRASHEFILSRLNAERPDDAVLSEEGHDGLERDTAHRVWIVDPLDGTSEFGQGRADFAVHVALWQRDDSAGPGTARLVAGCIDLPAQRVTYSSADSGAFASARADTDSDLTVHRPGAPVRVVVSRTRPPALAIDPERLAAALEVANIEIGAVDVLRVGSVGAKVAELLGGRADLYLHDSGFYEWDVAAPLIVAEHYGLRACHLNGTTITFNHRPPWVKDLVVGKPELVAAVVATSLD